MKQDNTLVLVGGYMALFAIAVIGTFSIGLPDQEMMMAQKMMLVVLLASLFVVGSGFIININPPTTTEALHEYADDVLAKKPVPHDEYYGCDTDEPDMRTPEERERDIKEAEKTLNGLTNEFDKMVAEDKVKQSDAAAEELPEKPANLVIPENDYKPLPDPAPDEREFKGNGVFTGKVSQTVFPILPDNDDITKTDTSNHEVGC